MTYAALSRGARWDVLEDLTQIAFEALIRAADRWDETKGTLGYVYLEDGRLLNLEIIARGYGHVYTRSPFSRMEEFRAAERHARETGRGLWDGVGDLYANDSSTVTIAADAVSSLYANDSSTVVLTAGGGGIPRAIPRP